MPAVTRRQQRFMGAELARKRAGKSTRTGMSESQLEEFATMKGKHGRKYPSKGSMQTEGDLGAKRQREAGKVGGFTDGSVVEVAGKFGSWSSYATKKGLSR